MTSTVDMLVKLAGPLGPLGSPEENDRLRATLKAGESLAAAARILEAVRRRPPLPAHIERRAFEFEAAELLSDLARDPQVRGELERALQDERVRSVALEAIALRADRLSSVALGALARAELKQGFLSEAELIRLASAMGAVAGDESSTLLAQLRAKPYSEAVLREIDVALEALASF